jgi:exopolysaccharide biosynthesis polyprenyl glycosylphosphotransferase
MIETHNQYRPYKAFLMVGDVALTCIVLHSVAVLRPFLPGRIISPETVEPDLVVYIVIALFWHCVFALSGVYSYRVVPSFSKQAPRFTAAYVLVTFAFAGFLFFTFRDVSRMLIVYFYSIDYIVLLIMRLALTSYVNSSWSRTKPVPAVIIGTAASAVELARNLREEYSRVLHVVGFIDNRQPAAEELPAPFLGTEKELPALIERHDVGQVFIALPENRSAETEFLVHELESVPVRVYVVPDMLKLALVSAEIEKFGDMVVIGLREPIIRGHRRVIKRIMDIVLSCLVLLVFWPLFLLIWIAIKLDSPGPVLYVAERVGENGKIFKMIKFRSMVMDAENRQSQVADVDDQGRPVYKAKKDPRVTRVGKWLRRTSLDELPQLFNVLKGEMSLVGPRPEQPFIAKGYDHWQWQRLLVPPGVTGWWQVSGRSDLPMHLNTQYDVYYVRNYNLLLDFRILLKTIDVVINGRGAY